jgi:hypothetical protein
MRNSPIVVNQSYLHRRIGERVLLWMSPTPHLINQTGEFFHTSHRMFHCVGQLVAAKVPYLDEKGILFTGTSPPSNSQRRPTHPVSIHLASPEVHPLVCISIPGALACHYSARTKINYETPLHALGVKARTGANAAFVFFGPKLRH